MERWKIRCSKEGKSKSILTALTGLLIPLLHPVLFITIESWFVAYTFTLLLSYLKLPAEKEAY